ncbi:flagellar export protein FliJ [uncultured Paraglaciecola sp.]|uniref:flagellar export protein FliJ n=1 Tax=uncultured Paraglaciecola sp. TaxID=1765024 RepID=UPI002614052B|nr:flagellar export protein FliJ [uncultured Paraglaciecola sp.]
MAQSQLQMVAEWERQKEQKLVQDFQLAQQFAQDHKAKLSGLENYRLNYLREAQQRAKQGVGSVTFGQHQQFIGKLDKACEMQLMTLNQAVKVSDQRRMQWLAQQRKRKAVEMLLDKQHKAKLEREEKTEQMMLDELSLQKFIRKS